ncbi:thiamine phosphate synthase [Risungbinella massiliensis]|uniref:thiamine phosphate synthase n=1 Tax=Risungbinella massiliensis TaxID=1329796 RepID=UPI0005CC41A5|nr:thiamine phosphate synthase [Risungbinella massiliensis]
MARIDREMLRDFLKVYFIMGSNNCKGDPVRVLKEASLSGITIFQYREKGEGALQGDQKDRFAKQLQSICAEKSIPFIVNDDIELALLIQADGVHIGQEDEPVEQVRKRIGDKILGVSVHSLEQARSAIQSGADYLGLGPIFPTSTKEDAKEVQGVTLIKKLRKEGIRIPIVGIGGITPENAGSIIKAGADGVAVITAISHANSVGQATRNLKQATLKHNDN